MTRRTLVLLILVALAASQGAQPDKPAAADWTDPVSIERAASGNLAALPGPSHRPGSLPAAGGDNAVPEPIGSIAASPTGAVGTALVGGWATWYATPGLTAAAGPLLRDMLGDWRGQLIEVESASRSVTVRLTDACACGERHGLPTLLDLSDAAFRELADLGVGVVRVSIEIGPETHPDDDRMRAEDGGPAPTLPATDATGGSHD